MIITPWLSTVGKYIVEHINAPHFQQHADLTVPPAAVLHTTEGGNVAGLDSEFEHHWAPHFLVGTGRIQQLVPVGYIGAALVTHNWLALVQVEVIARSSEEPWIFDEATVDVVAELMKACRDEYGIPLTRPWPDGVYGKAYAADPHRAGGQFGTVAGWFGHGDVPAPDYHWDPGNLEWSKLFTVAAAK